MTRVLIRREDETHRGKAAGTSGRSFKLRKAEDRPQRAEAEGAGRILPRSFRESTAGQHLGLPASRVQNTGRINSVASAIGFGVIC